MARRMVEAGVPFVRVSRAWWDSHGQNFETHLEMVPERTVCSVELALQLAEVYSRGSLKRVEYALPQRMLPRVVPRRC